MITNTINVLRQFVSSWKQDNHKDLLQQCHSMLHLSRETEYTYNYGKDTHVHAWLSYFTCSATPYVTMIWSAKHSHFGSPDDINCIMAMKFEKYVLICAGVAKC